MAADDEEQDDYGDVQCNSLDMPVHGSVVSEKDAKKIGYCALDFFKLS